MMQENVMFLIPIDGNYLRSGEDTEGIRVMTCV